MSSKEIEIELVFALELLGIFEFLAYFARMLGKVQAIQ
jgi:hypothetical protein